MIFTFQLLKQITACIFTKVKIHAWISFNFFSLHTQMYTLCKMLIPFLHSSLQIDPDLGFNYVLLLQLLVILPWARESLLKLGDIQNYGSCLCPYSLYYLFTFAVKLYMYTQRKITQIIKLKLLWDTCLEAENLHFGKNTRVFMRNQQLKYFQTFGFKCISNCYLKKKSV